MAFVKKMENGDKAPTLYTMYGKLYDFDEMLRAADAGLVSYLGTLRRGKKNEAELRQAYSDLMNGIKNGTITFSDGHYVDSTGTYDNMSEGKIVKNKNKDYYGLMANYIYNTQNRLKTYEAPEDKSKIKWNGNTSVGQALSRHLYNSDSGNILDFIDRDVLDPKTNVRGTTNRVTDFLSSLNYVNDNFDNLFTGYTPSEKSQAQLYLSQAISALLKDGLLDSDYLALSRAAGGLNYRNMFATGTPVTSTGQTGDSGQLAPRRPASFGAWLDAHYPQFTGQLSGSRSLLTRGRYSEGVIKRLANTLLGISTDDLLKMVLSYIIDPQFKFATLLSIRNGMQEDVIDNNFGISRILKALKARADNPLSAVGNTFYIPGTRFNESRNTGWVWDPNTYTLLEKSIHDIPAWQLKILLEYQASLGNLSTDDSVWWASKYPSMVQSHKKGGIIKALEGTNTNIFFNNEDFGYNSYLNKIWQLDAILDWMKLHYTGESATLSYADYVKNNVNGRYTAKINDYLNGQRYTGSDAVLTFNTSYLNNGDTPNYVMFGNSSDDYTNRKNGVVYSLADFNRPKKAKNTGDSYNENKGKAYIDNALGALTYSRVASLTDSNIKTGGFGKWGDYWKSLGNTGAYYYVADGDTSGRGQWIPTTDTSIKGYLAFDIAPAPKPEGLPKPDELPTLDRGTRVQPTEGDPKKEGIDVDKLRGVLPDLLGGFRLGLSINTNNQIANIVRKSLNPALINPDERFSPVTGAFLEMLFRSKLGADALDRYSQPFTSDASLLLAGLQEANRHADQLEYLGFLADDKEIKRTSDEALKRREWTHTNHIDTANKNIIAINQADRERALLEATRRKLNWQSIDNYIRGIEDRTRTKYETQDAESKEFLLKTKASDIDAQYLDAIADSTKYMQDWLAGEGNGLDITKLPNYDNWLKFREEAMRWRLAQLFKAHADIYGQSYDNAYLHKKINDIRDTYHFKIGGKLILRNKF